MGSQKAILTAPKGIAVSPWRLKANEESWDHVPTFGSVYVKAYWNRIALALVRLLGFNLGTKKASACTTAPKSLSRPAQPTKEKENERHKTKREEFKKASLLLVLPPLRVRLRLFALTLGVLLPLLLLGPGEPAPNSRPCLNLAGYR